MNEESVDEVVDDMKEEKEGKLENFNESLLQTLKELLKIPGMRIDDNQVLNHLEKEIKSVDPKLTYQREENIGIFVFVPSKSKEQPKKCILFDANIDTVSNLRNEAVLLESPEEYDSTEEYIPDILHSEKSALDNRVSVSILLEMVKKVRFDDTAYVALFSRNKNWGSRVSGATSFSDTINLSEFSRSFYNTSDEEDEGEVEKIKLDQIVVLDVYTRCVRSKSLFMDDEFVVFGNGCIPIHQKIPLVDETLYFTSNGGNTTFFLNGKYTKHTKITKVTCPVFTGSKRSYLALSDFFGMYDGICDVFSKEEYSKLVYFKNTNNTPSSSRTTTTSSRNNKEEITDINKWKIICGDGSESYLTVRPKGEKEEYVLSTLLKLLEMFGPSREERIVLDFVKDEIIKHCGTDQVEDLGELFSSESFKQEQTPNNNNKKIRIMYDYENYGLLVIIPSLNERAKRVVLFDAHIDTVLDRYIKPYRFELENFEFTSPPPKENDDQDQDEDNEEEEHEGESSDQLRQHIIATGLDNRIHCALLLSMIRFTRFKDTQYAVLFSVQEEIGCLGAEYFADHIDIAKVSGNDNFEGVVVFDVTKSKFPYPPNYQDMMSSEEYFSKWNDNLGYFPVVGGGVVPIDQKFGEYEMMNSCNCRKFKVGKHTKDVFTMRLSVCCTKMHHLESYASVSDLYDLFHFMDQKFEGYWETKKFVGERHVHIPEHLLFLLNKEKQEEEKEEEEKREEGEVKKRE